MYTLAAKLTVTKIHLCPTMVPNDISEFLIFTHNDDAINVFHADAKTSLAQSVHEMYFSDFICGFLSPVPSI
jgi:hypothetical protein